MCAPEIGAIVCIICLALCMEILCETANGERDSVVCCCVMRTYMSWTHFELASVDSKSLYLILNFISVGMTQDSGTIPNDDICPNQIHAQASHYICIVQEHSESKRKWWKPIKQTTQANWSVFVYWQACTHTHSQLSDLFSSLKIQVCQAAK